TCSYQTALLCATVASGAGSLAAIFLAQPLITKFSGNGLVPDTLIAQPQFLVAVALGAGVTVILASLLGFPISTTHSLTGALLGVGLLQGPGSVSFHALGKNFIAPLVLSPFLAVGTSAAVYRMLRA